MPRSFLIKKRDTLSFRQENQQQSTIFQNNDTTTDSEKCSNTRVLPLLPLNKYYVDLLSKLRDTSKQANSLEPNNNGSFNIKLQSDERDAIFSQPFAVSPLHKTVSPTDYYRNLLSPYPWYLHYPLAYNTTATQLQPHTNDIKIETPEEMIDVEDLDDTQSVSNTSMSTYSDQENLPITQSLLDPLDLSETNFQTTTKSEQILPKQKKRFTDGGTICYTYDTFFISDGRSRKKRLFTPQDNKTRYSCNVCGKDYATSSNLSRHKQTHRSPDSEQAKRCPHCKKVYVSMPALSMHILTHSLKHSCDQCGKAFSRPWLLQGHQRSHTGEKPFGCAHCGKAFADRSNLRAHMQTHSTLKQFKCKRCDKSFALKSYLNKHYESACFRDQSSAGSDDSLFSSMLSPMSHVSQTSPSATSRLTPEIGHLAMTENME